VPEPESPAPAPAEPVAAEPVAEESGEGLDLAGIIEMLRTGKSPFGENPLVQIGASVAAVAVPVLLYMALAFLKNKPSGDEEEF
jgi:hypothetical protein